MLRSCSRLESRVRLTAILASVPILVSVLAHPISGSTQKPLPNGGFGLEIILPDAKPAVSLPVMTGRGFRLIPRQALKITDAALAGQLSAVQLEAYPDVDGIKVKLSIIYNDLSKPEWWKEKQEKFAASFLIREGESMRPAELWQFGIEPFELRVISAKPVVLKPAEWPRVTNETTSLEVARFEKRLFGYALWLKNTSGKNVVAYSVSTGNSGHVNVGIVYQARTRALAAGATSEEIQLGQQLGQTGITISFAVFEDGTGEGDPRLVASFSAHEEGVRIQAPHILSRIEQTLETDDTQLQEAFEKLESGLWAIPEAIDKQSALEFLSTKFPSFDDKTISALYEQLKSGLYDARNIALASMGDNGRIIRERAKQDDAALTATSLRQVLEDLKQTFVKIVSANR